MAGAILLIASSSSTFAQCAMCRAAVGNSAEAAKASGGLNLAVVALIIPPVTLFCSFIVIAYRFRKAPGEIDEAAAENSIYEQSIQRRMKDGESTDGERRGRLRGDGGGGDGPGKIAEAI